jgi:hypothetical protein
MICFHKSDFIIKPIGPEHVHISWERTPDNYASTDGVSVIDATPEIIEQAVRGLIFPQWRSNPLEATLFTLPEMFNSQQRQAISQAVVEKIKRNKTVSLDDYLLPMKAILESSGGADALSDAADKWCRDVLNDDKPFLVNSERATEETFSSGAMKWEGKNYSQTQLQTFFDLKGEKAEELFTNLCRLSLNRRIAFYAAYPTTPAAQPSDLIAEGIKLGRDAARIEYYTYTALSSDLVTIPQKIHETIATACEGLSIALDKEPPSATEIRFALGALIQPLQQAFEHGQILNNSDAAKKLRQGIVAAATHAAVHALKGAIDSTPSALTKPDADEGHIPLPEEKDGRSKGRG